MDRERVMDRIRKMMNLANDSGASQGEIENALKFARDLMTQYGITEVDVVDRPDASSPKIGTADVTGKQAWTSWEMSLASVVGAICDVRIIRVTTQDRTIVRIVGYPSDCSVATELFPALIASIRSCARMTLGSGWTFRHRSFCEGFVQGLWVQARRQQEQAQQAYAIILRKDVAIDTWMREQFPNLRAGKAIQRMGQFDRGAFDSGQAMGERVALKNTMRPGESRPSLA